MTIEISPDAPLARLSLGQWLSSDAPASRRQAVLGNIYRGAGTLLANPAAVIGLLIVVALALVAVFAPLVAGFRSPIEQNLADQTTWQTT